MQRENLGPATATVRDPKNGGGNGQMPGMMGMVINPFSQGLIALYTHKDHKDSQYGLDHNWLDVHMNAYRHIQSYHTR